jgi:hypothetical protein
VPPEPPLEHPAASITTATADAIRAFRDFIFAPSGITASLTTGWVSTAIDSGLLMRRGAS